MTLYFGYTVDAIWVFGRGTGSRKLSMSVLTASAHTYGTGNRTVVTSWEDTHSTAHRTHREERECERETERINSNGTI